MGRPSRKVQELTRRRGDVLAVAEGLFSRKGFFKTSMAEVARSSKFSVGSLYQLFASKDAIYVALMEEKFEHYLTLVQAEVGRARGTLAKIDALIETKLRFFEKHRDFFRIYVTEWGGTECSIQGALGEKISTLREAYLDFITATMQTGVRSRRLKPMHPRELADALDGMMNAVIRRWIANPVEESLAQKAVGIRDAFFNGILVRR